MLYVPLLIVLLLTACRRQRQGCSVSGAAGRRVLGRIRRPASCPLVVGLAALKPQVPSKCSLLASSGHAVPSILLLPVCGKALATQPAAWAPLRCSPASMRLPGSCRLRAGCCWPLANGARSFARLCEGPSPSPQLQNDTQKPRACSCRPPAANTSHCLTPAALLCELLCQHPPELAHPPPSHCRRRASSSLNPSRDRISSSIRWKTCQGGRQAAGNNTRGGRQ